MTIKRARGGRTILRADEDANSGVVIPTPDTTIRLPDEVEKALYDPNSYGIKPTWASRITLQLVQGRLPEGMSYDEVIKAVMSKIRGKER